MPQFYFNLRSDVSVDDPEGKDLPDTEAARAQGIRFAVAMCASGILETRKIDLRHGIEVTSETGQDVLDIKYGDVITVEG